MKPIYISARHESIIETYLDTVLNSIKDLVESSKYNDFVDITNRIILQHNSYHITETSGNFHDFLLIIPVNVCNAVSGFFCGLENKDNMHVIKIHRTLLYEFALRIITELQDIQPVND